MRIIGGIITMQRARQAQQLVAFIRRVVPPAAPLVLAADLNLSISFESADGSGRYVSSLVFLGFFLSLALPPPRARALSR